MVRAAAFCLAAAVCLGLTGCMESAPVKAADSAAEWLSMATEQYAVDNTATETCNGQEFTVITYTYTSETNPYAWGISAFGTYGNYAVSVELSCREGFGDDALETLENFLEHCHYAA